ncbi:hypothetical protein EYZ11_002550 [Aspergillus tanneri]|uniref:Uncharacterized protein n=1 Tax=Aspergillus tanneri TaxID=1220188 RepID=A0A4S3JRA4_9EURO|nr:hypothetical protein EYZ11_002550 [Aspergillus tanneri]
MPRQPLSGEQRERTWTVQWSFARELARKLARTYERARRESCYCKRAAESGGVDGGHGPGSHGGGPVL